MVWHQGDLAFALGLVHALTGNSRGLDEASLCVLHIEPPKERIIIPMLVILIGEGQRWPKSKEDNYLLRTGAGRRY